MTTAQINFRGATIKVDYRSANTLAVAQMFFGANGYYENMMRAPDAATRYPGVYALVQMINASPQKIYTITDNAYGYLSQLKQANSASVKPLVFDGMGPEGVYIRETLSVTPENANRINQLTEHFGGIPLGTVTSRETVGGRSDKYVPGYGFPDNVDGGRGLYIKSGGSINIGVFRHESIHALATQLEINHTSGGKDSYQDLRNPFNALELRVIADTARAAKEFYGVNDPILSYQYTEGGKILTGYTLVQKFEGVEYMTPITVGTAQILQSKQFAPYAAQYGSDLLAAIDAFWRDAKAGRIEDFDGSTYRDMDEKLRKLIPDWSVKKCFVAGTPILMADGSAVPIEKVRPGDLVAAFDVADLSGPLHSARVTRTFITPNQEVWRLDRSIGVTPNHTCIDGDDSVERPLWQVAARGGSLVDAMGNRHRVGLRKSQAGGNVTAFYQFVSNHAEKAKSQEVIHSAGSLAILPKEDELPTVWIEDNQEIETVYNIEVEGFHTYVAGGWRVHNDSEDARQIGSALGSYLGDVLLDSWGVNNIGIRLAVGAVTSKMGEWIGDTLYHAVKGEQISSPLSFFENFAGSLLTSAVNMGGALLGRELIKAIGLQSDPLANGLASIVGGALAQRGAVEFVQLIWPDGGLAFLGNNGLFGVRPDSTAVGGFAPAKLGVSLLNAAGAFLGSFAGGKLAAAVFGNDPAVAMGAQIGGMIGSIIGQAVLWWLPFIGSFVGAFIGSFIGGALGSLFGTSPSWGEQDVLAAGGILQFGSSRGDGKALQVASQLAGTVLGLETNFISMIGGRLVGIDTLTLGMTEADKNLYARVGGFQYVGKEHASAVEQGALAQLKTARIAGGDLLAKQALKTSDALTAQELSADIAIASTYALYNDNKAYFNAHLDELMADHGGAAAWDAQKVRAEGLLDLDGAFTAANYRANSQVPQWNIGATTHISSIGRPVDAPTPPASMGTAVMDFSAPLVALDLNRDGVVAQNVETSGILFDVDGDGFKEQTGWLTPFDGFLVFDLDGNGNIDSIDEMVVSQAFSDTQGNARGILMSTLDSNANGYFDAGDTAFLNGKNLSFFDARVWTDRNLNGAVDLSELWSLTRFGIDFMSLRGVAVSDGDNAYRDSAGNKIAWESAYGILGAEADNYGFFTTLALAYDTQGVKTTIDTMQSWYLLEHENGQKTAMGLGATALNLIGGATYARTVFGGEGNDSLSAPSVAGAAAGVPGVFIDGGMGNDTIIGGAADDVLTGGGGSDTLSGGDGNDIISVDDADLLANMAGGAGHDTLIYEGNNSLNLDIASIGFEVVLAGKGNDHLWSSGSGVGLAGDDGDDVLVGTTGDDQLEGDNGDDSLTGGSGNDELYGGDGVDRLSGGEGDDTLYVDAKDFTGPAILVDGGTGTDKLIVDSSDAIDVDMTARNVEIAIGNQGNDRIRAGSGSEGRVMYGVNGDDILVSGAGADEMHGGADIDFVSYEVSNAAVNVNLKTAVLSGGYAVGDTLAEIEGVIGSQYADTLTGDDGDNILEGGALADILDGGAGRDAASYRSSNAAVSVNLATGARSGGHAAGDTFTSIENLIGSAYNDTLTGNDTDNVIEGGAGADTLAGGLGIDTVSYRGSSAGVTVNLLTNAVSGGDAAGDVLSGFENVTGSQFDDTFVASNVANAFDGLGGTDTVSYSGTTAGVAINLAQGLGGDGAAGDMYFNIENATGGSGNDVLTGDANANVLKGGDGDDTLNGGTGDRLEGELGNDIYTFGAGSGVIVIDDTGGLDAIRFGQGITLDDLQIEAREGDVFIGLRDANNPYASATVLANRLEIRGAQAAGKAVERLVFHDGSEMFLQTVGAGEKRLIGSDGNDLLVGDQGDNTLDGGAGKDWLFGGEGNDWLYGGDGDDTLDGGAGNDWLFGGAGDDILFGGEGDDTLEGGNGNDVLLGGPGNDVLDGGDGDDVLDGGAGNDVLKGGTGFDVYVQRAGGGYDRVYDSDGLGRFEFIVDTTFYGVSNTNSLNAVFGNWTNFIGVTPSADPYNASWWIDVTAYFADATYSFGILPTELQSHSTAAAPAAYIWSSTAVTRSLYTPGYWVRWDLAPEEYQATLTTNFQSDWMPNRNNPSQPYGVWPSWHPQYGWNNVNNLFTRFSLSSLIYVRPFAGGDFITGTEGNDTLSTLDGDDQVYGYAGNDSINGGNGDDALSGGDGVDTLLGGNGNDSIDGGTGNDIIKGEAGSDTLAGGAGTDNIEGGDGIDYIDGGEDVDTLRGGNGNDEVAGGSGNDTLYGDAGDDRLHGDGDADTLYGGFGEDRLYGFTGDDILYGEDGDDILSGWTGKDTLLGGEGRDALYGEDDYDLLDGGNGDDALYGGAGNDTLIGGTGNDHASGGDDNDLLDGGVGNDDLWGGAGRDMVLGGSGDDQLSGGLDNDRLLGGDGVDTIAGDDGDDRLYGDAGDDRLYGDGGNDAMLGGVGADALSGGDGNDTLWGQSGDDALAGGTGLDKLFGGDGADVLLGGDDADELSGGAGIDILNGGAGDDKLWGGSDRSSMSGGTGNDLLYGGNDVDIMSGGDGNDTMLGDAADDFLSGDAGDDLVAGGAGDDQISGGLGYDRLVGEAGNDSLVGEAGNDRLSGGDGDDMLIGDWRVENGTTPEGIAGDDQIWGGNGNDGLLGGAGDDALSGGANDDIIDGGEGADLLNGGADQDVLSGGSGNDRLYGATGNDTLFGGDGDDGLAGGDGDDALRGGDGNDRLEGGNGSDDMAGGAGADMFVFSSGFGADRITDFSVADGDFIELIGMSVASATITDEAGGARLKIGTHSVFVEGVTAATLLSHVRTGTVRVDVSTLPAYSTWSGVATEPTAPAIAAAPADQPDLTLAVVSENVASATIGQLGLPPVAPGVTRLIALSDSTRFEVVDDTLRLKAGLNFESTPFVNVTVTVTDNGSVVRTQYFRVEVADANDVPLNNITVTALTVAENAVGAALGTVASTDVDAGDSLSYSVSDTGNRFEIVGGTLRLKAGVSLDFEVTPTVPVWITATDRGGLTRTKAFTVTVTNVNEKPVSVGLSSSTLAATSLTQNGAVVGTLSAVDPDAGDTRTFTVSDDRFEVVSGQLKLKSLTGNNLAALLAAAPSPWLAVDVTATDAGGLARRETFFLSDAATTRQTVVENGRRLGDIIDRGNGEEDRLWIDAQDSETWAYRDEVWQKQATTTANSTFTTTYQSLDWLTRIVDVWVVDGSNEGVEYGHWEQQTESYQDWVTHTVGHTREIKTTTDSQKLSTVLVPDTGTATTTTEAPLTIGNAVLGGDQPWSRRVETREDGVLVSTLIDYDPVLNTIAENSVAAAVGTLRMPAVAAGVTRAYTVSDDRFEVVGTDLRLKAGKSLDFETPADATVTVLVTAVDSNQVTHNQYIRVSTTDIAERPTALTLSANKVAKNATGPIDIGDIAAFDQDANSAFTYVVAEPGAAAGSGPRFEITTGGKLRLKNGATISDAGPRWIELNVTVTDQTSLERTQAFVLFVTDSGVAAPHTDTVDQGRLLKQTIDLGNGTEQRLTFDADDSQVWSLQSQLWKKGYSEPTVTTTYDDTFLANQTYYRDVEVWVVDGYDTEGQSFGHWETQSEAYQVQVPTTVHHTVQTTTTYDARQLNGHTLNDDNEVVAGPTDSTPDGQPVAGGDLPWWKKIATVDNGTLVRTEYAYDPLAVTINEAQAGVTIATLPFVAAASGVTRTLEVNDPRFEIVNGKLQLKPDQSFDFETAASTSIVVTATDSNGVVNTQTIAVTVRNLNEAPTDISLSSAIVAEKRPGAVIGTLSGVDQDAGDHLKFSVTDSRFEIVNGQLKLRALEYLDHAATPTLNVAVTATDDNGLTFTETFTITVDVNDAPTNIALSAATVSENAAGAAIGTLTVTDPDTGDSHVFSVSDDRFEVVNGQLKLKAGQALDFEAAASVSLVVTATDRGGLSFQKPFTITVVNKSNDANETLNSTTGNNILDGGPGIDTASFSTATAAQPLVIDLQAGTATGHGTDTLIGIENVIGGAGNDQISGSGANETLNGGAGDDVLDGRAGDDTLIGGLGNDTINGGFGNDTADYSAATATVTVNLMTGTATGAHGTDTLSGIENVTGGSGADTLTLSAVGGTLYGNNGNDTLVGGDGHDTIYGGAGNDTLTGEVGIDTLIGGIGNDVYNVNGSGTVIVEQASEGTDTANVYVNGYTLASNVEAVWLKQGASLFFGNNTGSTINALVDQASMIYGGEGIDTIQGSGQADTLFGGGGNDGLYGNAGADVLVGGSGDDTLNGGTGIDNMTGGVGNDIYYVDNVGDGVVEAASEGVDTLYTTVSYALREDQEVENLYSNVATGLTLTGSSRNDKISGAAGNDTLIGGAGDDTLNGNAGTDTMTGGAGNDIYYVERAADVVVEAVGEGTDTIHTSVNLSLNEVQEVEVLRVYGTAGLTLTGSSRNDALYGNSGNDTLQGGNGNDTLAGGAGNDTLNGGGGTDTADFSGATAGLTIDLVAGTATGEGTDTLISIESVIGGAGNDIITGSAGVDVLEGGAGNDTLNAGDGDDTLRIDGEDGSIAGGAGFDSVFVQTSAAVTLNMGTASIEWAQGNTGNDTFDAASQSAGVYIYGLGGNDIQTGSAFADYLDGGDGNDVLTGGAGVDVLDGGAGNDTLNAGDGDDTLRIDSEDASIAGGAGFDSVFVQTGAAVTLNMGTASVEWAQGNAGNDTFNAASQSVGVYIYGQGGSDTLTGSSYADYLNGGEGNDVLAGGSGADTLIGDAGDDTLNGGSATDTMTGGLGNDIYYVERAADVVVEAVGEGTDTIYTSVNLSLNEVQEVEVLRVYGTAGLTLTGSSRNDVLYGNSGNDTLQGGNGNDTLAGGAGNDTLNGGGGTDTADFSGATAALTIDLVAGTATGEGTDTLISIESVTGGTGNDTITGNSTSNVLVGGRGNDTLRGEGGVDTFGFSRGDGNDRVYASVSDGADTVKFDSTVRYDQLWFQQLGNDLVVSVIGEAQAITVNGWYAAADNHLGAIVSGDGYSITDSGIQQLVAAMVSLTPPSAGTTNLPSATASALAPTLAANWQHT